jgi:hypothetical protein
MRKRSHRGTPTTPEGSTIRTPSVHVLSDEEDLRRALRRAAEFDQRTADLLLSRSAHYRALLSEPAAPAE